MTDSARIKALAEARRNASYDEHMDGAEWDASFFAAMYDAQKALEAGQPRQHSEAELAEATARRKAHNADPETRHAIVAPAAVADPPWLDEAAEELFCWGEATPADWAECENRFKEVWRDRVRAVLAVAAHHPRPVSEKMVEAAATAFVELPLQPGEEEAPECRFSRMRAALEAAERARHND